MLLVHLSQQLGPSTTSVFVSLSILCSMVYQEKPRPTPNTVVPLAVRPLTSSSELPRKRGLDQQSDESGDMDDLLFMLKTQNFSESLASDDSEHSGLVSPQKRATKPKTEHFERRRISIADTHL